MNSEADALSEFCGRHQISTAMYFKIARKDLGPRGMRVGRRTLICREAAEQWRRAREATPHRACDL